jgi:hypothetical protein
MATQTLGTDSTTTSIPYALVASPVNAIADIATVQQHILDDVDRAHVSRIWPGAWSKDGVLYVPNRGFLKVLVGDVVGVDTRGWPILLSADTIANGPWSLDGA